jgi:hypothetical protein
MITKTQEKLFRVVEVPRTATAEETETTLNDLNAAGYYLINQLPTEGAAFRALFKLRTRPEKKRRY